MNELPLLLTVPEAADVLRVSPHRVYELIRQHIIPSVRMGRQLRVPRQRLMDWMETEAIVTVVNALNDGAS